ncbi:PREDICTED: uncharacterized protein At4g06744-like [Tarenaya hassleriana]|uniref:uncharacterized protein At4g06744-like n=1 Tax=Tarenaya hassleriana TaxID=28532 RepID=UPI00053C4412|nr:PREDICTED: uncharacterized protein At4g06744-like [Tarenaya hassleriana]
MQNPVVGSLLFFIVTCLVFTSVSGSDININGPDLIVHSTNISDCVIGEISGAVAEILNFVDERLAVIYPAIQKFKSLISSDPFNVTGTWVGSDICSYRGFFCDNPPDNGSAIAVASIDFNGFQLSAPSIDGFLDQLPDLAIFHANTNNFGGVVPPKIAELKYLYEFDISNNRFSGPFPTAVLGMPGLTFLDIRFNRFTGSVPPQIFTQNLDVLFINDNEFTANLPETLGETHIQFLTLANNKFNGPIPRGILRAMSTVTEVLFLNNELTGCLPYELGFLKEARVLDVGQNRLTGRLPMSLTCLEKAEQLNFAGNFLFGAVPETVCMLQNLANFSLSDNYFTHVGPFCRILIERGVLDVRNNCIPFLPNQRPFKECLGFLARPKYCSHMWFHSFIPCKFSRSVSSSSSPHSSSHVLAPKMSPSP